MKLSTQGINYTPFLTGYGYGFKIIPPYCIVSTVYIPGEGEGEVHAPVHGHQPIVAQQVAAVHVKINHGSVSVAELIIG